MEKGNIGGEREYWWRKGILVCKNPKRREGTMGGSDRKGEKR